MKEKNILITGISGLIGKHIAIELLKYENSFKIFGQYFSSKDLGFFIENNIQLVQADISKKEAIKNMTQNMNTVVHSAARVIDFGTKEDFYKAHYYATLDILEDCKQNMVKHFIYISSIGVASGIDRKMLVPNEQTHTPKTGIIYDDVKIDTEILVKDFCAKNDIFYTIVRPSAVVGPASVWVKEPLERIINKGFFPLIDDGKQSACLIDVRNLANGIYAIITNPIACNQTYFFMDDFTNITWKMYFTDLLAMVGAKPSISLPYRLIYPIAVLMEKIANISGKKPLIAKKSLQAIGTDRTVSCQKAKDELKWESKHQYNDTISYIKTWVASHYPNHK
jgi:nucleoside-diphosphate-sugar epimerase